MASEVFRIHSLPDSLRSALLSHALAKVAKIEKAMEESEPKTGHTRAEAARKRQALEAGKNRPEAHRETEQ